MESPSLCLSPEPCFASNGCINFEIQGSKVCSTIRPLTLGHCFGFLQRTHVWKAPTGAFHHSLVLPGMVAEISRSKGPKCARLSAPSLWATVLVSFKGPTYEEPQPVPFTIGLFCQQWLHQFRDPRVQRVLDYPPTHCEPLFWFLSKDPCMESPNQRLSAEPCFARNGCISFEIQGAKVCSTIRPLTRGHCFGCYQGTHVWEAPTSAFHRSIVLRGMVASVSRSKAPKCARLPAPLLWATALVSFKEPMYVKPQPVPFTKALFCQQWLHQFRDPRVQSVLDYPPPHSKPLFWLLSRDPCMESPNKCLLPQPCFARNGCISFEIQGSKVCSTIRPLTVGHCFGFFQGTHVWKTPTGAFHQSLVLPGMVASPSGSKGRKCAGLSAPSVWATVMFCIKEPMYQKPQPVPFSRGLFCLEWLHLFRDPRVQSVLDYPPPHSRPLFWFLSKDPRMESANQCLLPKPCFARNGGISFEIQGSKVCSSIRPLTLGHCFGFLQRTHVLKAPTSAFHQSLVLPGMVASVSRSKGAKCARLSAPSL